MTTQEYETKILDIDIPALKYKLHGLDWFCSRPRRLVRRWVFSLPREQKNAWVRIVEESDAKGQLALAYKSYESHQIGGIREHEFMVKGDMSEMKNFFELIGCSLIAEQHNYEEEYRLQDQKNVKIDIEEWPLIPPYAEVESDDEQGVMRALVALGFDTSASQPITTKMVYKKYGLNLHDYKKLTFD